jgi:folate-binding protein YgfZ
MAVWGGGDPDRHGLCYADPRLAELGWRCMLPPHRAAATAAAMGAALVDADDYETHRIALGLPRGGVDFAYNDAFPHEADMDQLGGVDFNKGCFVGQEVVSRIEHRGIARTRVIPVAIHGAAPEAGVAVTAGSTVLGTMGSGRNGRGMAALRLDRTADAMASGVPLTAGAIEIRPLKPAWARFAWPGESEAASGGPTGHR